MRVDVRHVRGVTVVEPGIDRLHIALAREFREGVGGLADAGGLIVLDLSRVRYMDSAGLGALLTVYRNAAASGGSLCVASVRPQVATLFRVVQLSRVIGVYDTVQDALDRWSDEPVALVSAGEHGPDGREQG